MLTIKKILFFFSRGHYQTSTKKVLKEKARQVFKRYGCEETEIILDKLPYNSGWRHINPQLRSQHRMSFKIFLTESIAKARCCEILKLVA